MKHRIPVQYQTKIIGISKPKFLKGIKPKSTQDDKVPLIHTKAVFKLQNNKSSEPEYYISPNLINRNQQKQYFPQSNLNYYNHPSINKNQINPKYQNDNIKVNQAQKIPQSGDVKSKQANQKDHLFNDNKINNINNNIIKYSSLDKKLENKPNAYQKINQNQEKATLNNISRQAAMLKQPEKNVEKLSINPAANNSPENKTKPIRKDNYLKKKQILKKKMNVNLDSSNKKNKGNLLDSTSKEDKKNPYFSQDNFHQISLFRNKKEDNSDSNKRKTPNYNEAVSRENDIRTKNFNNYFENKIKDIVASKGSQPNNKNEAEKFKKLFDTNGFDVEAKDEEIKNKVNEIEGVSKIQKSAITNPHLTNEWDIMNFNIGRGSKSIMTKEQNENIGAIGKNDELKNESKFPKNNEINKGNEIKDLNTNLKNDNNLIIKKFEDELKRAQINDMKNIYKSQIDIRNNRNEEKVNELNNLKNEINKLKSENAQIKINNRTYELKISELQEIELKQKKENEKIIELMKDLEEKNKEIENIKKELMEKDDEINKLKKQNDLIKESDNQNKQEINSLKKKLMN